MIIDNIYTNPIYDIRLQDFNETKFSNGTLCDFEDELDP
jgi:hypothetical protein